MNEEQAFWTFA